MATTLVPGINSVKLNPYEVGEIWNLIAPLLQTAVDHNGGEYGLDEIHVRALNGSVIVWVAYIGQKIYACCVAEIAVYPNMQVYRILLLAGKHFELWSHFEAYLEEDARKLSCSQIEAICRPGMAAKLYPKGYGQTAVIVRKTVNRSTH